MKQIIQAKALLVVMATILLFSCKNSTDNNGINSSAILPTSLHDLTDVIVHDIFSPPVASRIYAYSSIAGYEAAVHGDTLHYISLAGQVNGLDSIPQPEKGQEYCFSLAATQAVLKI